MVDELIRFMGGATAYFDMHPSLFLLSVFASLATSYQCYMIVSRSIRRRNINRRVGCKAPERFPHKDPFFGTDGIRDALQAGKEKRFLPRIWRQYEEFGNTFSSRFLTYPVINTIEPENIKAVLATNFKDYCIGSRRKNSFFPLLGKSIGLFDGVEWEHSRALLRPSFAKCQVGNLPLYEAHFQDLLHVIEGKEDSTIDLQELFFRFTADVTTDLMFGESIDSLMNPGSAQAEISRIIQEAVIGCEKRWQLGPLARFVPQPGFWNNVAAIRNYIEPYVKKAVEHRRRVEMNEEKEQGDNGRYIFLQEISKKTTDRIILRDELLSLFFGGRDTTACLLSNLFWVLARRPDIWGKIRAEVAKLEGQVPTSEQLKELKYIRFSLLESLRIHPVLPCNSRIAARDTILPTGGGPDGRSPVFVAEGTMIAYHVTALHRRKDLWGEDANEYRPERWKDEKLSWNFLPFNGGPRTCIGQELAMTESSYTTIRLAQHFDSISPCDLLPFTEALSLTYTSANGVKVSLSKSA